MRGGNWDWLGNWDWVDQRWIAFSMGIAVGIFLTAVLVAVT
jgi:hypothetical protein